MLPKAKDVVDIEDVDDMNLSELKALAQNLGIINSHEEIDERVLRMRLRSCAL